jgi:serine/threonine protein kinase
MAQPHSAPPRRGTLFLQYELQEDLGEGAFGRAVRARRRRDDQPVVVKIMHPDTLSDSAREEVRPRAGRTRACARPPAALARSAFWWRCHAFLARTWAVGAWYGMGAWHDTLVCIQSSRHLG